MREWKDFEEHLGLFLMRWVNHLPLNLKIQEIHVRNSMAMMPTVKDIKNRNLLTVLTTTPLLN